MVARPGNELAKLGSLAAGKEINRKGSGCSGDASARATFASWSAVGQTQRLLHS